MGKIKTTYPTLFTVNVNVDFWAHVWRGSAKLFCYVKEALSDLTLFMYSFPYQLQYYTLNNNSQGVCPSVRHRQSSLSRQTCHKENEDTVG